MDNMTPAPREAGTPSERKPWRRPTLERLDANSAGTPPGKLGNAHDHASPQATFMS
jgi:hypothetical protein